ncbi:pyrroline-5-carboxylate reductase [Candidatus Peregrinibacteria bacterium]|nr:MAG: pyrroline-5-carboxylate reductase [Candidatus Peregrinibacteria bacterium]
MRKILVIGAGNMGEAIVRAAISRQVFDPKNTFVLDMNTEKCSALSSELGISLGNPEDCDTVLLAVKPQHLSSALPAKTAENPLLISVLAGTGTKTLQDISGTNRICRVMPNTPALVGAGISALFFSPEISTDDQVFCQNLFSATGGTIELKNEDDMHAVTALSGSGPAYFFRFVELLSESGVWMGLPREMAEELAKKTFIGSAKLLEETGESAEILRQKVTSPRGTTAAALQSFAENNLGKVIQEALFAAQKRSKELGGEKG